MTKIWWPGFNVQLVLLSQATGSVSSGNLSAFGVTGSKVCKIAGDNIVTIGKVKVAHDYTIISRPKLCHQSSIVPYSIDNCSKWSSE